MRITAGKREDILRRKAEYDAQVAEYDARNKAARQKMRDDEQAAVAPLKEKLESDLSMWDTLEFDVRVERDWGLGSSDSAKGDTLEVHVNCNEHRKFNDNVALSWSYHVKLRGGEIQAETSSWSGMKATTREQLDSLRETLYALEYLNRLDWKKLLATTLPDVMSYYKDVGKRPERQDFDAELMQAEVEELIGTNKIIRVKPWESAPYRGDMYLKIMSETASQYKVIIIPAYTVESGRAEQFLAEHTYENRVRKSSVRPVKPLDIVEV